MFFRNVIAYRFTQPFTLSPDELEAQLATLRFHPCGQLEPTTLGFTPPLGRQAERLVHVNEGRLMLCATREDRVLPASVVNAQVAEVIAGMEAAEGRKVGRKEKKEIHEKVVLELLPRAFAKSSSTYAYIDPRPGWLLVDASSFNKAEEVVSLIRKAVGSLPVISPVTALAPAFAMTQWLATQTSPEHFVVGDECSFVEPKTRAVVRCKGKDLGSDEVCNHLDAGMQVAQLALTWEDRISFVLDTTLAIRRLKYLEGVTEVAADIETDDAAQRFDADFSIMAAELAGLLDDLIAAFGGEKP